MDTIITVIQVFFIIGFTGGGLSQLLIPSAQYAKLPFQGWANDFKPWHIKLIGFLKLCAAAALIASLFVSSLAVLTLLSALGLALLMAGAIATHLRREEYSNILGNLVFLGLALLLAYGTLVEFAA
jgi:hypothetical protein